MAKAETPILKTIGDASGLVRFYICEEFAPKNGDQEYFGIIHLNRYKTWAFFSQNQLNDFSSDYKLKALKETGHVSEIFESMSGFKKSKLAAIKERFFFNAFLLYVLIPVGTGKHDRTDYVLDSCHKHYLHFNRDYDFLSLIFNDKPETFFSKKVTFSYKQGRNAHFPSFNCSFTQNMRKFTSVQELLNYLYGDTTSAQEKILKRSLMDNWVYKYNSSSYEINFYFMAFTKKLSQALGNDVLCDLITQNKLSKILKNDSFQDYKSCFIGESAIVDDIVGLMKYLFSKDKEWAIQSLVKWDLPTDEKFLKNFENYVETLKKEGIEIQLTRYPSLLYVFNLMSKEYSKIKGINFELPNAPYENLELAYPKAIGEYKVVLAKDYKTLIQWGAWLHNCSGNFEQQKYYKKSINLGLFKDGKIEFLASIVEGRLTQLKGFKNSSPSKDLFKKLLEALLELKAIREDSKNYYDYNSACVQTYVYAE